jgi:hypothetical protein
VSQHLIVDVPRLTQALHEQTLLVFIRIEAILKRAHSRYFTWHELNYHAARAITHPLLTLTKDVPSVAVTEARGFTGWFDKKR